jgi:hypothetical protein
MTGEAWCTAHGGPLIRKIWFNSRRSIPSCDGQNYSNYFELRKGDLMGLKATATTAKGGVAVQGGQHAAVCIAVIDLGTHQKSFQGQKPYDARTIFVAWELTNDPSRPAVGIDFNFPVKDGILSFSTKNKFRVWLKNWRNGKDLAEDEQFDFTSLIGKKCQITIEQKVNGDKKYSVIANLTGLLPGTPVNGPQNGPLVFDLDDEKDQNKLPFPEWMPYLYGKTLEDHIAESYERKGKPAAQAAQAAAAAAAAGQAGPQNPAAGLPVNVTAGEEIPW